VYLLVYLLFVSVMSLLLYSCQPQPGNPALIATPLSASCSCSQRPLQSLRSAPLAVTPLSASCSHSAQRLLQSLRSVPLAVTPLSASCSHSAQRLLQSLRSVPLAATPLAASSRGASLRLLLRVMLMRPVVEGLVGFSG
jgi:hypothetical protein